MKNCSLFSVRSRSTLDFLSAGRSSWASALCRWEAGGDVAPFGSVQKDLTGIEYKDLLQ